MKRLKYPKRSMRLRGELRIILLAAGVLTLFFVSTGVTSAHIDSLIPESIVAGGPDFELRILGTEFDDSDPQHITFDGAAVSARLVSQQEIRATIPATLIVTPRVVEVALHGFNSRSFRINPASQCVYEITIGSGRDKITGSFFSADGGNGFANIETQPGCTWVANLMDTASFSTLTSVSSEGVSQLISPFVATGSGSGKVTYSLKRNLTTDSRDAVIRLFQSDFSTPISADPFTITELGTRCPASGYRLDVFETAFDHRGGSSFFRITAPPGCSFTATADQPWINLDRLGATVGADPVNIHFDVPPNDGSMRSGTITAAGKSFAVMQLPDECFIAAMCAFLPDCDVGIAAPSPTARKFRDAVLSKTARGRQYTRLYYQLSAEAVRIGILHPMLMLRSRDMILRYKPLLDGMIKGDQVSLTEADVEDIDDFLQSFALRSSSGLKETLKQLREDLRNPEVQKEFNVSVVAGPKRDSRLQSMGELRPLHNFSLSIVLALGFLGIVRRKRQFIFRLLSPRGVICCFAAAAVSVVLLQPAIAVSESRLHQASLSPREVDGLRNRWPMLPAKSGDVLRIRPVAGYHGSTLVNEPTIKRWPALASSIRPLKQQPEPQAGNSRLAFATYLGGSGNEEGDSIAVDPAGNIYVAGFTDSANFPLVSPSQPVFGGGPQDAFVAKLDPSGTRVIYSTYIGGDGQDNATAITVDSGGNAYIAGYTNSTNFPVRNALQTSRNGEFNAFVAKLDPSGALVSSTLFGGTLSDFGSCIAVDATGKVIVAGIATSADFPLANAFQSTPGGLADGFVAKIDLGARSLAYSTYLGGAAVDGISGVAVDSSGNAYLTGITSSSNFPTRSPFQARLAGGVFDAFVTKLSPDGAQVYSTFLGGSGEDRASRIAVDSGGNAYITGDTDSPNFPANVSAPALPEAAAFVTKLNPSGNQLVYSRLITGNGSDGGTSIAVDSAGSAYVAGFTNPTNFPSINSIQQSAGGKYDGFVVRLSIDGSTFDYSTYFGGSGVDSIFGIAANSSGAYVMGVTESTNIPTASPLQPASGGGQSDLFIARIAGGPFIAAVTPDGKRLLASGSGFDAGAKILINGAKQKTTNDGQNPGGLLIGKKANKLIPRGSTVTVQVRNADGTLSNEIPYQRL